MIKNYILILKKGSFKVHHGGFEKMQIQIVHNSQSSNLPITHTCSNTLELPSYSSKEIMRQKLK